MVTENDKNVEVVSLPITRIKPNVVCSVCGKQFRVAPSRVKKTKVCSRRCYAEWRRMKYSGENNPAWKGAVITDERGYVMVRAKYIDEKYRCMAKPNGYVYLHRLVMASELGRPLLSEEIVHHVDRDKGNNAPDNLKLMTASAHTSEHMDEILEKRGHVRRA
jgi:hypothetical protein